MSETPELYVSACCGTVVAPGNHDHDNIVDAEQGARLCLDRREKPPGGLDTLAMDKGGERIPVEAPGQVWERVHEVTHTEAELYDAVRAGECPSCGREAHGLDQLHLERSGGDEEELPEAQLDLGVGGVDTTDTSDDSSTLDALRGSAGRQ